MKFKKLFLYFGILFSSLTFLGEFTKSHAENSPLSSSNPNPSFPKGDGKLRLYNYHLQEFLEVEFRKNDALLPDKLAEINRLLRSRDQQQQQSIDPNLVNLLDYLQDHFEVDTVEIISGYRSPEFNQKLLSTGHQVSPRSLHMQGKAIDIHLDEIREETLQSYLLSLKLGGVGYYGPLDFVHIDTGNPRQWGEKSQTRKLVGVLDPTSPIQLTSNQNDYLPNENLFFTWKFPEKTGPDVIEGITLQHFWRGKWIDCPTAKVPQDKVELPSSSLLCGLPGKTQAFGKYRWRFKSKGNEAWLSSNEFYLKKE